MQVYIITLLHTVYGKYQARHCIKFVTRTSTNHEDNYNSINATKSMLISPAYENLGPNIGQTAPELSLHILQSVLITRQYIKSLEKSKW